MKLDNLRHVKLTNDSFYTVREKVVQIDEKESPFIFKLLEWYNSKTIGSITFNDGVERSKMELEKENIKKVKK